MNQPSFLSEAVYFDFRRRDAKELSGNGNTGTVDCKFSGAGAQMVTSTDSVQVPNSSELLSDEEMTWVFFCPEGIIGDATNPRLYDKRSAAGTHRHDITCTATSFNFNYGPTAVSWSATTGSDFKYLGISAVNTGKGKLYKNGVFHSNSSNPIILYDDITNDSYIGNGESKLNACLRFPIAAAFVFTRVLTPSEHAELYGWLQSFTTPQKTNSRTYMDIKVNTVDKEQQGDEITIVNNDFTSLGAGGTEVFTGWTNTPNIGVTFSQIGGNSCRLESDGTFCAITQNVCTVGKKYKCTFNITDVTSGAIRINNDNMGTTFNTTGNKELVFVANSTAFGIKRSSGTTDVTFTDITLYEYEGITACYNMKSVNNSFINQANNNYNLTLSNGGSQSTNKLFDYVSFNGVNNYATATGLTGDNVGANNMSLSFWFRTKSTTDGYLAGWWDGGASYQLLTRCNNGAVNVVSNNAGGAINTIASTTGELNNGVWHHCVVTTDGTNQKINIDNGAYTGTTDYSASGNLIDTTSGEFTIGARKAGATVNTYIEADIASIEIYNYAISDAKIEDIYNKGQDSSLKTDWAIDVSKSAGVSTANAFIENSSWQIDPDSTGAHKIVEDTFNGETVKCIQRTAGQIYLSTSNLGENPEDAAYGEFEFWFKGYNESGNIQIAYIGNAIGVGFDPVNQGYLILATGPTGSDAGRIRSREINAGSVGDKFVTNTGFISSIVVWNGIKIVRKTDNSFSTYHRTENTDWTLIGDLDSGTNPFTDSTYKENTYISVLLSSNTKFLLSDISGDKGFVKKI